MSVLVYEIRPIAMLYNKYEVVLVEKDRKWWELFSFPVFKHHGCFETMKEAEEFIERLKIDRKEVPYDS